MSETDRKRDGALDALRGITVILMILVNLQGSDATAFMLLKHAPWNGLTVADLVFPIFLLVTGLSVPLALGPSPRHVKWSAILRRVLLLFLIGVVLGWLIKPSLDPSMVRWAGVLQRIAIVYLVCVIVAAARPGAWSAATFALALLTIHSIVLLTVAAPGETAPTLVAGSGISGWLDQHFLPGRVHRVTWDPEGLLSTVSAVANGLIGVAVMRSILGGSVSNRSLAIASVLLIGAGLAMTIFLPLNKSLWTASFALTTSGIGLILWASLRRYWPLVGQSRIAVWLEYVGRVALTVYVAHMLLIAVLVRRLPDGMTIWEALYDVVAEFCQPPAVAALLFAVIATGATLSLLPLLERRGWILKV
jgi:predicted acyltransferase